MTNICLPAASDMHLHLRQGEMLANIAHYSSHCHRVLVMPNINPSITTGDRAVNYKLSIQKYLPDVDILTTIKFIPETSPQMVLDAYRCGVTAVKLYPRGVTTNAHDGICVEWLQDPRGQFLDSIETIRKTGMTLCLHGEMPDCELFDSEHKFLDFVDFLAYNFPRLRIVLEHISTQEQVNYVRKIARQSKVNIAATITVHHLFLTLNDVIGDRIKPHNFCKPVAKFKSDRDALRAAAMSAEPYFFLGSDSAPHDPLTKECAEGCAGCFTAPVLIESLIELFEAHGVLDRLPNFISKYGNDYYILKDKDIPKCWYSNETWTVPTRCGGVRPFRSGELLKWRASHA